MENLEKGGQAQRGTYEFLSDTIGEGEFWARAGECLAKVQKIDDPLCAARDGACMELTVLRPKGELLTFETVQVAPGDLIIRGGTTLMTLERGTIDQSLCVASVSDMVETARVLYTLNQTP